jgi:hypothetical protein
MTDYVFQPEDRGALPGSPYTPPLAVARRVAHGAVGVIAGLGAGFGNAVVTTNLGAIGGSIGPTMAEAMWLPVTYVALNATANLFLVRGRLQFGVPAITHGLLALYGVAAFAGVLMPSAVTALGTRAVAGVASAAVLTLAIYHLTQALPAQARALALVLGVTLPQFGTPLARLMPVDLLAEPSAVPLLEGTIALILLGASLALPLPPSIRAKGFEWRDLVTFALFAPGVWMICAAIGQGRSLWWWDTPWIMQTLSGGILLVILGLVTEHSRARPLILTRWLGQRDILRFVIVALLLRLALAEQSYGAVGFLTSAGLVNQQLRVLFAIVTVAMVLGLAVVVLVLTEARIPWMVATALLLIALAGWLDSGASSQTSAAQLYVSQALIGFSVTLAVGPALLFGFIRVLRGAPEALVSLVVVFSLSQNLGGLAGASLLGSYQIGQARFHAATLAETLDPGDPMVATRLGLEEQAIRATVTDPQRRHASAAAALNRSLRGEASVLAFNDTFRLISILALAVAAWIAVVAVLRKGSVP